MKGFSLFLLLLGFHIFLCEVPPEELDAIQIFYNSTLGEQWRYNKNWMTGDPCENGWFRLSCNPENTNIVEINLPTNLLGGTLPTELASLTKLTGVDFDNNHIGGTIPTELGLCSELQALVLEMNAFTGSIPSELALLQDTSILVLSYNRGLKGTIPTEIGALPNATRVWISYTSVSGTIPTELGNLKNIDILYLNSNSLTGSIPTELGNLELCRQLDLSNNTLTGSLPTEIGKLQKARSIMLNTNKLSGEIPTEVGNLEKLKTIDLHDNKFRGTIPSELGRLEDYLELDFSTNKLSGTIPTELGQMTKMNFFTLAVNEFSGTLPTELMRMTKMTCLQLEFNSFSGSLPTEIGLWTSMKRFNIGANLFTGSLPTEVGNYHSCTILEISLNSISGTLPTELKNMSSLQWLNLEGNAFEGTIPTQLGILPELNYLIMNENNFQGTIPSIFCSSALQTLSLDENNFTGTIPSCLVEMPLLEAFSIQSNQMTGPINWMENFKNITTILLRNNSLSDYLGPWVCETPVLDLSENPSLSCPGYCDCHPCLGACVNSSFVPQISALQSLYIATEGKGWNRKGGWMSLGTPPCLEIGSGCTTMWEGVECICEPAKFGSEPFQIVGFSLEENNMKGSLPSSTVFPYLPSLQQVNMAQNTLKGDPPFSEMLSLSQLHLLDLSNNHLQGTIPDNICKVPEFNLQNNHFTCPLPSCCSQDDDDDDDDESSDDNLCAPCQTFKNPKKDYTWIAVGGVVVVVVVVVVALVLRAREKRPNWVVDEGEEEMMGLLSPEAGGVGREIEDPHEDRYWWKSEGSPDAVEASEEFLEVCQYLVDSQDPTLEVTRVWHIENNLLWKRYTAKHSSIKAKLPLDRTSFSMSGGFFSVNSLRSMNSMKSMDSDLEGHNPIKSSQDWMVERLNLDVNGKEAFLFHGTKEKYVQTIQDKGFDGSVGKLTANFGSGCYFTDDLKKAMQDMAKNKNGMMFLFIVRVSLGFSFHTSTKMKYVRRAPQLQRSQRLCDSVIGSVEKGQTEYVVYEKNQCYPELLLEVKKR